MVTKLSVHRAVQHANLAREDNLIKFFHHLTRTKRTQVATTLTGRTFRMVFGHRLKTTSLVNLRFNLVAFIL
jgi:hypothetical protein